MMKKDEPTLNHILRDFDEGVDSELEAVTPTFVEREQVGDQIGTYTLEAKIGEGGFGVVWEASQTEPLKRRVAVKILKPGLDTHEVLARFDQERQALARMNHPHIAKVFDAGTTERGLPYFVMELANGEAITRYLEEKQIAITERLRVFQAVCRAVGHAHQRGIMHRDIKPSNILLIGEAPPEVKIIDFGIAKALDSDPLTDLTLVTRMDRLVGTPRYMSPEQVRGAEVDTRSDIYSLGLLLYEILVGENPLERSGIESRDLAEKVRLVVEQPTPSPIQVWRQMDPPLRERLASSRNLEQREFQRLLKGDLASLVLKALEKEPDRRYGSSQEFAEDVERYLEHRPILARPPSALYSLRRYALRNRAGFVAGGGILIAIVAGLLVSLSLYGREKRARADAVREADRGRQVTEILSDTLSSAGYSKSLGRDATMMRELLDKTTARLDSEQELAPEVEAELRRIVGITFRDLEEYDEGCVQLRHSVDLLRQTFPESHPELLKGLILYSDALEMAGRRRDAEEVAHEAVTMSRHLFDEEMPEVIEAEGLLAWILMKTGRLDEALPFATRAYQQWLLDPSDQRFEEAPKTLASIYKRQGDAARAIEIYREEWEALIRLHGPEHPSIANLLDNLGAALVAGGRFEEAEPILEESLAQGRQFFGDRCPHEDHVLSHLAKIARRQGDFEKEHRLLQDGAAVARRVYPKTHPYRREAEGHLLRALFDQTRALLDGTKPPFSMLERSLRLDLAAERVAELEALEANNLSISIDTERLATLRSDLANQLKR